MTHKQLILNDWDYAAILHALASDTTINPESKAVLIEKLYKNWFDRD